MAAIEASEIMDLVVVDLMITSGEGGCVATFDTQGARPAFIDFATGNSVVVSVVDIDPDVTQVAKIAVRDGDMLSTGNFDSHHASGFQGKALPVEMGDVVQGNQCFESRYDDGIQA